MRTLISISFCMIAALAATAAFAETKPGHKTNARVLIPNPAHLSDTDSILKIIAQIQSDVQTLQIAVANLATSQKDQAVQVSAQLKDMTRRLYATCVLTQRQMDMTVPGGWSENALCTYRGLTAAGQAVTQDIFGQNPTNIDAAFGGP